MNDILKLSTAGLARAFASGQISAQEATSAYLDAAAKCDPQVGAYLEMCPEHAMAQARELDSMRSAGARLGPLAGVPVAIKDNLCTAQGNTTCASRMLANFKAPYVATSVAKLQEAGAIILGKTNMDEFAMGSSTENSSAKVTRNPWDLDRVPGGSSGGSAAAVAARTCAASLGSDTGGSIRQPAAFCGVVGLKPTYGRVSRFGLVAFGSSLDQVGPLTRDVTDAALVTSVIAGHDPLDSTSIPKDSCDYISQLEAPLQGLRVGLVKEFMSEALGAEIHAALDRAVEVYRSLGATVIEVSLPHSRIDRDESGQLSSYAVGTYYLVATAEASSNLARYDGVHYGHRTAQPCEDILELYSKSRAEGLGDEVKRRIMLGAYALSSGYYDAYYVKALKVRRLIKNDFESAFATCDVLLSPTTPTSAFKIGEKTADPLTMYLGDIYTISVNLAGLPALSIPAGLDSQGLPIGMQLIGPVLSEDKLLRAGRMFEKASGICDLVPPMLA